jgi:hypothetical protein
MQIRFVFMLATVSLLAHPKSASFAAETVLSSRRLVIVAPEKFRSALTNFVAHKQKLLPTELWALEDVLKQNVGFDDPEKLKKALYKAWCERGVGYVLLVGDVDVMPVRFMVLDRVTPAAFDYAFYPSDLYYADLANADGSFEDWNAHKESFHAGYFGEVRGEKNKSDPINFDRIDYRPEIAVGRWPVSTAEEARLVATKSATFELEVINNQANKTHAALVAVGGWVDSRPQMERLSTKLEKGWHIEKLYYSDASHGSSTPPSSERVRALFDNGTSLVIHAGHGQSDAWEQCFSSGDLDRIANSNRLSVVLSVGCSTAYFAPLPPYGAYVDVSGRPHEGTDNKEIFHRPPPPPSPYQRGKFNPTGLGEQMLKRNANGAAAYIGCNTGSQPCALTLLDGFVAALTDEKNAEPRLGDCWVSAINYYYEHEHLATLKPNQNWYPPSIFFQGMKFMVFGDPSLRLHSIRAPERPQAAARAD